MKLTAIRLLRPRNFGDDWLGCLLWQERGLSTFWKDPLDADRGEVLWDKVLQMLAVNRLGDPGSEFAVLRRGFLNSAMDERLGVDCAAAGKDRRYRRRDRILPHKDELCRFLAQRWRTLFDAPFDVLLYDLTRTCFEGLCQRIPKAQHGYGRDGRGDGRQGVIALVLTTDGLPLEDGVMPGNTADKTTLKEGMARIETRYGPARRVWIMDRGIPTEARLAEMRREKVAYRVGTPRTMLNKLERDRLGKPWQRVHEGRRVRLLWREGEW